MKNCRSVPGLFLILFLIFGVSSYSLALEVPVFSPLRYTVDVQGTAVYTETVRMGNVVSGEFHLIVQNGSNGANRVDLAEVSIDGKRLVKLTQSKDFKDKKFKLLKDSELRISLTGPRGSFVVVSIIARKVTQVPLVIRMPQGDAQAAMTASLLKIKKKPTFANHGFVPSGSVMSQTPQAGLYVKEKSKASITVSTGPAQIITVLPGESTAPASQAVIDYDIDDKVTPSEIETITPDVKVARTKLLIAFNPDATVDQINTLLTSINGYITAMLKGVNQLIVRIPDPGTLPALDTIVGTIQANSIVRYVLKATMPVMAALPPPLDPTHMYFDNIAHHLDVRAHAAWNAKSLIRYRVSPHIIVADGFGDGHPNADFAAIALNLGDFKTGDLDPHGYHVLGIMAGTYGGNGIRGSATGMYPGSSFNLLTLSVVDAQKRYTSLDIRQKLMELLEDLRTYHRVGVILNTSLGYLCPSRDYLDKTCIEPGALAWIEQVRGPTLLHLTAAGNIKAPGDTDAVMNSEWTAAASLSGLVVPETGYSLANLTNTLVIENRDRSPVILGGTPGCLAADSKFPGNFSGIGQNVFSLTGSSLGYDWMSGTSMATPQVAGLAAYLWTIKPDLTPQEIMDILITTADSTDCGGINPRPLIDAYAAVLALDRDYPDMEVRRAILDLNEDRFFNETDVEQFLTEFDTANGAKDYSRYDLNGDGMTGGDTTAKFNLNMDYSPTYTTVSQTIEGNSVSFNENSLTDLEILCYYAYSRLYTGDTDKRRDLLAKKCGVSLDVTFAEAYTGTGNTCEQDRIVGVDGEFTTPLSLPIHLTAACGGGSSDMTVQKIGPNHIVMDLSSSAKYVQFPDQSGWGGTAARGYAEGRIISGTYTIEIAPVVTTYNFVKYIFSLSVPGNNPYFEFTCTWDNGDPSECSVPVSTDIVIPEYATHHWDFGMHSATPYEFAGPTTTVTVSGRAFSIKPK
jgi:subtilisin family serine protease